MCKGNPGEMFKVTLLACFCVTTINLAGLSDGKPITGLPFIDKPKATTIQIPGAIISREELVALAQYAMRMMASRINITLQATTNHADFPQYPDHVQGNSEDVQSTTPTAIPSMYYETLGKMKQMNQKLPPPRQTVGGMEKPTSLAHNPSIMNSRTPPINSGARLMTNEHSSLTFEPFVRYAERNLDPFPDQFGFEIIPNSQITTTYTPQAEKVSGVSPPMQQVLHNPFLPSALPITSSNGGKDSGPSNIRLRNLTIERVPSSRPGNAVMSVPFEAIITFTRQKPLSSKLELEDQNIVVIPTRDPPDDFPPYFDTILSVGKKTSDSRSGLLGLSSDKNINPARNTANEVSVKPTKSSKPMNKRQTPKIGELIEMLTVSMKGSKANRKGTAVSPTPSSPIVATASRNMKPRKFSSVTFEENTTTQPKRGPMFQRQEIEEEEEEEEGSLGSITDLLPLVLPILEDLSDPNTETDIGELLEAGLPLVQGISQGDGEEDGIDLVGIVSPVIASLSAPNRNGNGTVFQAILPLILPLVSPFIGPIVGPIIQGLSNPADQGGSSITPLIQALAGPLSLPTEPGGVSIASSLISGIIASLSKDLKAGGAGGSDIGALASTLVSGVLAGGSAGLSAKFMKPSPPPAHYGNGGYGQGPVPASSVDPLELVGTSLKDILGLTLQLVKSVISSVTGILGASSMEPPRPVYGPAKANSRIT